jgi:hypothetical protein
MIRLLLAMMLIASTGGCTSRMIIERDDAYCQSKGTKPGSQAYFQCRLKEAIH